jgi:hypothetical protein
MTSKQEWESFAQAGIKVSPDFDGIADAAINAFFLLEPWYLGERSYVRSFPWQMNMILLTIQTL